MKKLLVLTLLLPLVCVSQGPKKYPALLWKISGKHLQKPSYIYGTMHVSNRVAYNLSEQFFDALKSCEVVGLETNPGEWLQNMEKTGELSQVNVQGTMEPGADFFTHLFYFSYPSKQTLQGILSYDPDIINDLLYRQNLDQGNFEENTYIDLFIFQTASKLNKQLISLEDFAQSEIKSRLAAMPDRDEATSAPYSPYYNTGISIEDAYRDGNLDLLDSLSKKASSKNSQRYLINDRNVFFANTIDSVLHSKTIFAGVGAAHLPGANGLIELLRKRGYTVEAVMPEITRKSHHLRDEMEAKRKPVVFTRQTSHDSVFSLMLPGRLYQIYNSVNLSYHISPDMVNGNFYTVVRLKHNADLFNSSPAKLKASVDSLLFENIQGRIISKTEFTTSTGIPVLDVVSKTRTGDLQHCQFYFTSFELLMFKLGGKGNYAESSEGKKFFTSIQFKSSKDQNVEFTPPAGGFKVKVPSPYLYNKNDNGSVFSQTEDLSVVYPNAQGVGGVKRGVYNDFTYLEEDSFELNQLSSRLLQALSFTSSVKYSITQEQQLPCIRFEGLHANGKHFYGKIYLRGVHYYLVYWVGPTNQGFNHDLFTSFTVVDFKHLNPLRKIKDKDCYFTAIDEVSDDEPSRFNEAYAVELAKSRLTADTADNPFEYKNASKLYYSPSTNEYVNVYYERFNGYDFRDKKEFVLGLKRTIRQATGGWLSHEQEHWTEGMLHYSCMVKDTATRRALLMKVMVKNSHLWELTVPVDTVLGLKGWAKSFYESFMPVDSMPTKDLFTSNFEQLLKDLAGNDTTLRNRSAVALKNAITIRPEFLPSLNRLLLSPQLANINEESKALLFVNAGAARDNSIIEPFQKLYTQYTDSFYLQISLLKGLAYAKTAKTYATFKTLLLKETPLIGNSDMVDDVFQPLHDSLPLCKDFFPSLLQLCKYDEYREAVYSLLADLVHQKLLAPDIYLAQREQILADANLSLKRKKSGENQESGLTMFNGVYAEFGPAEKALRDKAERLKTVLESYTRNMSYSDPAVKNSDYFYRSSLLDYVFVLSPFYNTHDKSKQFIQKASKQVTQEELLLATVDLLKYKASLSDTLLNYFASNPLTTAYLYSELEKEGILNYFPEKYKHQERLVESLIRCQIQLSELYNGVKEQQVNDSISPVKVLELSNKYQKGKLYIYGNARKQDQEPTWCLVFVNNGKPANNGIYSRMELIDPAFLVNTKTSVDDNLNRVINEFHVMYRKRITGLEASYDQ